MASRSGRASGLGGEHEANQGPSYSETPHDRVSTGHASKGSLLHDVRQGSRLSRRKQALQGRKEVNMSETLPQKLERLHAEQRALESKIRDCYKQSLSMPDEEKACEDWIAESLARPSRGIVKKSEEKQDGPT